MRYSLSFTNNPIIALNVITIIVHAPDGNGLFGSVGASSEFVYAIDFALYRYAVAMAIAKKFTVYVILRMPCVMSESFCCRLCAFTVCIDMPQCNAENSYFRTKTVNCQIVCCFRACTNVLVKFFTNAKIYVCFPIRSADVILVS